MKKTNKKGFTLVELVIVIAVIAILAAVLLPTFKGIIEKARISSALQGARNAYTEYLLENDGDVPAQLVIKSGNYFFSFEAGQINATPIANAKYDSTKSTYSEKFASFPTVAATTTTTGKAMRWHLIEEDSSKKDADGYVENFFIFDVTEQDAE